MKIGINKLYKAILRSKPHEIVFCCFFGKFHLAFSRKRLIFADRLNLPYVQGIEDVFVKVEEKELQPTIERIITTLYEESETLKKVNTKVEIISMTTREN